MDDRISQLAKGHELFRRVQFAKSEARFKKLVKEGQNPKALFIGCSDSRVVPSLITDSEPGDLFIVRNIGNFVPPFKPDADYHATAAAIEYAVSVLEIADLIVCGHSHCGAIAALYKDIKKTPENIHTIKWLELGNEAKNAAMLTSKNTEKEELLRYTEKLSVVFQLKNLLTYPAIRRGIEEDKIYLHGWHYDIEKGNIEYYDDESFEFKPLGQSN